jgi:undecaprenyl-diphosphatase
MLSYVLEIDRTLFEFFNGTLNHPILDWLMPIITKSTTWIFLYVGIVIYFVYKFKKLFYIPLLGLVLTFAASDYISASVIKPQVNRIRPCNEYTVTARVVGVTCRNSPSFPSSHATNHFGIATFMFLLMYTRKRIGLLFWLPWAAAIAYSRIYVGVHYPGDVIGGAILGVIFGILFANIANRFLTAKI